MLAPKRIFGQVCLAANQPSSTRAAEMINAARIELSHAHNKQRLTAEKLSSLKLVAAPSFTPVRVGPQRARMVLLGILAGLGCGILLVAIIVISSLMAVVYIWRVVESAYFREDAACEQATEAPLGILIPTWIAVFANYYFGLFPDVPLALSSAAAETLLGQLP